METFSNPLKTVFLSEAKNPYNLKIKLIKIPLRRLMERDDNLCVLKRFLRKQVKSELAR